MPDGSFEAGPLISPSALKDQDALRGSHQQALAKIEDVRSIDIPRDIAMAEEKVRTRCAHMREIAEKTGKNLKARQAARAEAETACHLTKWEFGETREAQEPNVFHTILTIWLLLLIETGATSMVLISDGAMGAVPAVLYGLVFAAANIAVGQCAGYFGLRQALFRKRPEIEQDDPRPRQRRRFGWSFFLGSVALLGVMIYSAARLRATGSHEGIFTFSEVSLAATLNDANSILIVAIGLSSAVLNVFKGHGGWTDPMPEYDTAWKRASELDEEADAAADDAIDEVEDSCDAGLDDLEETSEQLTSLTDNLEGGWLEVAELKLRHNAAVESRWQREQRRFLCLSTARTRITGAKPLDEAPLRHSYEALKLPDLDMTAVKTGIADARALVGRVESLKTDLEAERDRQAAVIANARDRYHAAVAQYDRSLNWD